MGVEQTRQRLSTHSPRKHSRKSFRRRLEVRVRAPKPRKIVVVGACQVVALESGMVVVELVLHKRRARRLQRITFTKLGQCTVPADREVDAGFELEEEEDLSGLSLNPKCTYPSSPSKVM